MNCPYCEKVVLSGCPGVDVEASARMILAIVCQSCNGVSRLIGMALMKISSLELDLVKASSAYSSLRWLQLRNSCERKSAFARNN